MRYHPDQISPEFVDRVRAAHAPQPGWSTAEPGLSASEVEKLAPHEHAALLHHAAEVQRGRPEQAMLNLKKATGGGAFSHLAEHIGDITHRLNESGGAYGTEFVETKVNMALRTLRNRADRADMEKTIARPEVAEHAETYVKEHRNVPVYNEPSQVARHAAVALGKGDFQGAEIFMNSLAKRIANPDQFKAHMSQEGSVAFLRQREERGY